MYGRQYDNLPHLHDSDSMRGSMMGNDYVQYGSQRGGKSCQKTNISFSYNNIYL